MVKCLKVHWPVSMKKGSSEGFMPVSMKKGSSEGFMPDNLTETNIPETWRATGSLHDSGKARAIGVGNFKSKKIGDLLS